MAQIHRTLWFRFLLLTLLSSMAAAQLPVAEDTSVASGTTTPQGTNTNLSVAASPITGTLVKFDLSGVPAGTTGNQVTKATVKLYVNTVSLSGTLDVCQVTSPWTEASTVFTSKPTLSATPLATAVPVSTASKYIVVDITTAVKAWQNGTANNGIALLPSSATPCNSSTYGAPSTSINVKLDGKENISASHDAGLNVVLSLTNGTVTSVGTGEGLTGGPITGSGTISIVPPSGATALGGVKGPNAMGACAAGSHFSGIAVDGTLTCTPDSAATSLSFSAITNGLNTGQSLVVGSGSSLDPSGGTITANMLSAGTYGPNVNISGNAGTVTNGVYTTGAYADPSWITSLSGFKISGSVANAVFANSAGTTTSFSGSLSGDVTGTQTGTVVSAIGGAAPSLFARRDQANTFSATQALSPLGNTSQPSNPLQLNATDGTSHSLSAQLQALSDGSLSFQFGPTGSAVQKLFIDNTGKITFATGQTFPGSQNLTAGTGIAINGNAIDNTGVLSFNGRNGSVSSAFGDYSFAQISGAITPAQASLGLYGIDISGNANTATAALTAGSATTAGDSSNLGGQPATNYARLDIGNSFNGNETIAGSLTSTVSGNSIAITGQDDDGLGVYGKGMFAVRGDSASTTNGAVAVFGNSTALSGITTGVKGTVASADGFAGYFDNTAGGKILSGRNNGTEVFSVDGNGKITGDGSGLTNVTAGTFTGTINGSQVSGNISGNAASITGTVNGSQVFGDIAGNATSITGTISGGQVSGSVASALTAGSATTATSAGTAAALQGTAVSNTAPTNGQVLQYNGTNTQWQPADITGNFIQNGTSQQTTASFNIDGTGVLGGSLTAGGAILPLTAAGNSKPSFPLDFKATGNTGTSNTFRLLANGSGATPVFDFQTCSGTSCTPSSTGLSIDNTGKVTFASGQTFPAANFNGTLAIANGGTGATTALGALTNLGAAARGTNSDITSLSGLTTALSATQGGTGLTSSGSSGNLLRSNGTTWTSSALTATDIPSGSGNYIQVSPASSQNATIDLASSGTGVIKATNNGSGAGVFGTAVSGVGVYGFDFGNGDGLLGQSSTGVGVEAVTNGTTANSVGLLAEANSANAIAAVFDNANAGGKVISGRGNHIEKFSVDGSGNVNATGTATASKLVSTVATGTAPLTVASTTQVTNLNAQMVGGFQIVKLTQSLAPTVITVANESATGHCVEQQFTITGLAATDVILSVNPPGAAADIGVGGWRNTGGGTPKLAINFCNASSNTQAPPSGTYIVVVLR
jgi:hypothetical protein